MYANFAPTLDLHLPFGVPAAAEAPAVFGRAGTHTPLAGARVLVVEDNEDCRELTCGLLTMAGATVLCVESVAQAMDGVYHSFDPDVVLSDFSMPGADGLDLIREFRQAPTTRALAIPILILSGHTEDRWRLLALQAGAADFLTKPFDAAFLIGRIAAAVAPGRSGPH